MPHFHTPYEIRYFRGEELLFEEPTSTPIPRRNESVHIDGTWHVVDQVEWVVAEIDETIWTLVRVRLLTRDEHKEKYDRKHHRR